MTDQEITDEMRRALAIIQDGVNLRIDIWYANVLFSWRWWLGIVLALVTWSLWVYVRQRKSTHRLLYAGVFVMLVSLSLDSLGMQHALWNYPYPVMPFVPAYLPYDLALMPVMVMLVIQYKTAIHPFWKGLLFASVTSFAGEPFFRWLGIYDPIMWKNWYSPPFYFAIFVMANWLARQSANEPLQPTGSERR